MTKDNQQWDEMTDQHKIEWLAVKVMGWKKIYCHAKDCVAKDTGDWLWVMDKSEHNLECPYMAENGTADGCWNPLTDWNHTMDVGAKMKMFLLIKTTYGTWRCAFKNDNENYVESKDAREAICKAAFLALQ